jgi:hypothetical protein
MEETAHEIEDMEFEILEFLREWVWDQINRNVLVSEMIADIREDEGIRFFIKGPLFNVQELVFLVSLQKFFRIQFMVDPPREKNRTSYLVMIMKPKKNAIKMARKILRRE